MAIIIDPDNLDRQQMIFGTDTQKMSFYPVGALVFNNGTDGAVVVAGSPVTISNTFTSTSFTFTANHVGSHIIIQSASDPLNIGSYEITGFTDANNVLVDRDFNSSESGMTFNVATGITAGTTTFTDINATFQTDIVAVGDILCIFSGPDAGHYRIASVPSETTVTVDVFTGFTAFQTYGSIGSPSFEVIAYTIHDPSGGSAADGATIQSLYSFGKEEWRSDSMQFNRDDLIKHEFPYEAITSEQFEIGGGAAHYDWTWHNGPTDTDETIHYIRTGGWADKDNTGTTSFEYAGIITLGSVDADAQVYYQQIDATQTPQDFVLTGPVNQSVLILDTAGSPDDDRRTYLKLFVRKKARTYAQSEIDDIGVSNIQTIVNRFPLSHAIDAAITDIDGDVIVTSPYTNATTARTLTGDQTDGITTATTGIFSDIDATFISDGVVAGDALLLGTGASAADQVYWHIIDVVAETTLTVSIADATLIGDTGITYSIHTNEIVSPKTDGALADIDGDTGSVTSTGSFAGVAINDMVVVTEPASDHRGVYKITDVTGVPNSVIVNTEDKAFTTQSNIDFYAIEPSMKLQYKWEQIVASVVDGGSGYDFADVNPDTITTTGAKWASVLPGDIAIVSGSTSNDGSYTVASATGTVLTLIGTDTLTAEVDNTVATIEIHRGFSRSIAGVIYGFKWRVFGNNASAADCYQYVQHQLRQVDDIDFGPGVSRGDVTDLLMTFSTPTGIAINMHIDDISSADLNNVTFRDATGTDRLYAFVAAGSISFNDNLQGDTNAKYWMFFTNDNAGDNIARDYGTKDAIIVLDAAETPAQITGNVNSQPSVSFTYDYTNNVQRGAASAGSDAPITIVAIGLDTAQFVITTGSITESKTNNFSLVAALERNYSNP
jgi:hypothetical protein